MPRNNKNEQALKKYTDMLKPNLIINAQDTSLKIFEALQAYEHDYEEALETNAEIPTLWEVMFALKNKTAEYALEDNNLLFYGGKYTEFIKKFLKDPVDALTKQPDFMVEDYKKRNDFSYKGYYQDDFNIEEAKSKDQRLKNRINDIKDTYYNYVSTKKDIWKDDQELNVSWFKVYFKNENQNVDEILASHKGGFFENFFGTTSNEYKEFAKSFKNFLSDTPDKGNYADVRQNALNYLDHKLPSFKMFNASFDEKDIEKLDATGKGRVMLCLNTIKAIDKACKAMDNGLDINEHVNNNVVDLQSNFQEQVQKEVAMPGDLNTAVIIEKPADLENNNNIIQNDVEELE